MSSEMLETSASGRLESPAGGGSAKAVAVSGGTGFAGAVLLLPDGVLKEPLLLLSPAITVVITLIWDAAVEEINARVADWRIQSQKRQAEEFLRSVMADEAASLEVKTEARKVVDALALVQVRIRKRRISAFSE